MKRLARPEGQVEVEKVVTRTCLRVDYAKKKKICQVHDLTLWFAVGREIYSVNKIGHIECFIHFDDSCFDTF
jgi:hypothetical protein